MPSRRALLLGGGAAMTALCGGLLGVSLLPPAPRVPRRPLRALSPRAFAILAAVADRICPGGPDLPDAWSLEVPEGLDELLDRLHPDVTSEISQALYLLENPVAGTLLDGRVARFTQCSPTQQDEALQAFATSSIGVRRQAWQALRGLVSATYWSHPATWAHAGYAGPPRFPGNDPAIPWRELPPRPTMTAPAPVPPAEEPP